VLVEPLEDSGLTEDVCAWQLDNRLLVRHLLAADHALRVVVHLDCGVPHNLPGIDGRLWCGSGNDVAVGIVGFVPRLIAILGSLFLVLVLYLIYLLLRLGLGCVGTFSVRAIIANSRPLLLVVVLISTLHLLLLAELQPNLELLLVDDVIWGTPEGRLWLLQLLPEALLGPN
jgi:hypothetical protein